MMRGSYKGVHAIAGPAPCGPTPSVVGGAAGMGCGGLGL